MKAQIEKIKAHVKDNWEWYAGSGLVFASLTLLIVRRRHAGIIDVPDGPSTIVDLVTVRPLSFLSKQNVVTVVSREGRGHPGYIVKCLETGAIYLSQGDAARDMNISPSVISQHLGGKFQDANGFHFERLAA